MAKQRRARTVISRICKQVLLPAGFIPAQRIFVRACGDQVHGINVQTSWGQLEYAINIAFHYSFLPSVSEMRHKALEEYDALDFMLRSRLGEFVSGYDQWWKCTPVDAEFEALLRERLATGVKILDDCAAKWSDPGYFLNLVPPAVLAEEVPIEGVEPDEPSGTSVPKAWRLLPEWCPQVFEFAYFLCEIALREGQFTAAVGYADIALREVLGDRFQWQKDVVRELRAKAVAAQSSHRSAGRGTTK